MRIGASACIAVQTQASLGLGTRPPDLWIFHHMGSGCQPGSRHSRLVFFEFISFTSVVAGRSKPGDSLPNVSNWRHFGAHLRGGHRGTAGPDSVSLRLPLDWLWFR
jgi:hypothetical protein